VRVQHKFWLLFFAFLACLLAGCSAGEKTALAEADVPRFHAALDAGNHAEIYDAAGDELQKAGKREDFIAFLGAVHRKLGNVKSSKLTGWQVGADLKGNLITLVYDTEFTEGKGAEQFAYRIQDKQAVLVGYHINAPALILK